jgi:hypothetical protein
VHLGGSVDLGCAQLTSIEEVLGFLYANPGEADDKLCQAQIIAGRQVAGAILNTGLENGKSLAVAAPYDTIEKIGDVWCNGTPEEIIEMSEALDAYNNVRDYNDIVESHEINPEAPATPRDCRRLADDSVTCIGEEEAEAISSIATELGTKEVKQLKKAQKAALKAQKAALKAQKKLLKAKGLWK